MIVQCSGNCKRTCCHDKPVEATITTNRPLLPDGDYKAIKLHLGNWFIIIGRKARRRA